MTQHPPALTQAPSAAQLNHLALFPLPGAVLFPNTLLPLHIFEPRYRAMTAAALEQNIPIAIVKLIDPRTFNDRGLPTYHEIGGIGLVTHAQQLPDGRYNILLQGTHRVRILEELDSPEPYRIGRAELIVERSDTTGAANALIHTLKNCVVSLQRDYGRLAEVLSQTLAEIHHPGTLADIIASLIISDPELRQQMLEEPRIDRRLDEVVTRLADLLATSGGAPEGGSWLN